VSDFFHYLEVTPMIDYPWWGLILLFLFWAALIGAVFVPFYFDGRKRQ
jgi:hypothetical protein